ncbi:hypothetical protein BJX76DRAFT_364206 [Aspergillus varians]
MSSKTELQESQTHSFTADAASTSEIIPDREFIGEASAPHDCTPQTPTGVIIEYLLREAPQFRRLSKLRKRGWDNPEGDRFFKEQRQNADRPDKKTAKWFYKMMKEIGYDMQRHTGVFQLQGSSPDNYSVLDMCMAPGGFLATAVRINPEARALGFSLPDWDGGHGVLLPEHPNVTLKLLDITMLAEDMGLTDDIPSDHPDATNFLPRQFTPDQTFDLVICDGQVLRTHERAAYREKKEASRLTLTQLALGLEHVKPGGTMVVLLHKVEALHTVRLLHTFSKFASVQLYKHAKIHAKRSSFYMIATNIRAGCEDAIMAIEGWKDRWKIATFGTDEMYHDALFGECPDVEALLEEFGPRMVQLGKNVWNIQANALAKAPFVREMAVY